MFGDLIQDENVRFACAWDTRTPEDIKLFTGVAPGFVFLPIKYPLTSASQVSFTNVVMLLMWL